MPSEQNPPGKKMLSLSLESDLIRRVDQFVHEGGFSSRTAAIKWLLEWALDCNPNPPKPTSKLPTKKKSANEKHRYRSFTLGTNR